MGLAFKPGIYYKEVKHTAILDRDDHAYYWIFLSTGRTFNTYEWYIASKGKHFIVWKNYYYDEKNSPVIITKRKQIKKIWAFRKIKNTLREEFYKED